MKKAFQGHLPALDGVRGLAISLVMAVHLFSNPLPWGGFFQNTFKQLLSYGALGVEVFFVLSGFLITGILQDSRTRPGYFKNFYMRRCLRIFPLYYGVLALVALWAFGLPTLVQLEPPTLSDMQRLQDIQGWLWSYGLNVYIWVHDVSAWTQLPYVAHFWSLCVEEHFYVFWPLVVFFFPRKPLMYVSLGMVAFSMFARMYMYATDANPLAIYVLTFCRLDALCLGSLLALAVRGECRPEEDMRWMRKAAHGLLGGGALFIVVSFFVTLGNKESLLWVVMKPLRETAFNVVFAGICACALVAGPRSLTAVFFCSSPLRFLGRYSYGLYVYHAMLASYFVRQDGHSFVKQWLPNDVAAACVLGGLGCVASCLIALLSFHVYEKHFLKLKVFFSSPQSVG